MRKAIAISSILFLFSFIQAQNTEILYIDDTVSVFDEIYLPINPPDPDAPIFHGPPSPNSYLPWVNRDATALLFTTNRLSNIYGIALSTSGATFSDSKPQVMYCNKEDSLFKMIDSIGDINRVRTCTYNYDYNHPYWVSPFFEIYFDHPYNIETTTSDTLQSDSLYFDSIYLVVSIRNYYHLSTIQFNYIAQTIWTLDSNLRILPQGDYPHNLWGGVFPIMKLRCNKPKEWRMTECNNSSATVKWRRIGDEEVYRISVGLNGSQPDSGSFIDIYDTSISSYTFSGSPGENYSLWLRKACRYTTPEYDTLVWSDWTPYIGFNTVAIDAVGDLREAFTVGPNPASRRVTLRFDAKAVADGGTIMLLNIEGHLLQNWHVDSSTLDLDIGQYPAGTYLLRLVTPHGIGIRRLAIAR